MNKYLLTLIGYYMNVEQKFQCVMLIDENLDEEYSKLKTDRDIMDFCYLFSNKYKKGIQTKAGCSIGEVRIINWQKLEK